MKKIIALKTRNALIGFFAVTLVATSFLLIKGIAYPGVTEGKNPLYNYNIKDGLNYKAVLKPNLIYENGSQGEEAVYITKFVDHIKAFFQYEFTGERPAEITGDYELVAVMEGYTGSNESYKTIWQKSFVLEPKTAFESNGKSFSLEKTIALKLDDYNNFVNTVIDNYKVGSQVDLSVYMNVNLKAKTDAGLIEEYTNPNLVIPLSTDYFEIAKNQTGDKAGAIEETQTMKATVNMMLVSFYGVLFIILAGALVVLIYLTTGETVDFSTRSLNVIFKRYGNRLVALNNEIKSNFSEQYRVKSMADLVRVADEIGKPIMYKHDQEPQSINRFYVFDHDSMYIFDWGQYMDKAGMEGVTKSTRWPAGEKELQEGF